MTASDWVWVLVGVVGFILGILATRIDFETDPYEFIPAADYWEPVID